MNSSLLLLTNTQLYSNIDLDTAILMREFANTKLPRKNKEGKYNMCKAIEDIKKQNQEIGADKALISAIHSLMKNTKHSFEEVCKLMDIDNSDMVRYKNML